MKMRVFVFVDGLNLYHALRKRPGTLWLDIKALVSRYLTAEEALQGILYFTAYCTWDGDKVKRHKAYIAALASTGVRPLIGKFRSVSKFFVKSRMIFDRENCIPTDFSLEHVPDRLAFRTYAEKETDVALGVNLLDAAVQDLFDVAIVLSGDSDICPAIKVVKQRCPNKLVRLLVAEGNPSRSMKAACDEVQHINEADFYQCQFPTEVTLGAEKKIVRPQKWA